MCKCGVYAGGRESEEEGKEDMVWGEGGSAAPLARYELILFGAPLHLEQLMRPDQLTCRGMMVRDAAEAWRWRSWGLEVENWDV